LTISHTYTHTQARTHTRASPHARTRVRTYPNKLTSKHIPGSRLDEAVGLQLSLPKVTDIN